MLMHWARKNDECCSLSCLHVLPARPYMGHASPFSSDFPLSRPLFAEVYVHHTLITPQDTLGCEKNNTAFMAVFLQAVHHHDLPGGAVEEARRWQRRRWGSGRRAGGRHGGRHRHGQPRLQQGRQHHPRRGRRQRPGECVSRGAMQYAFWI